MIVTKAQLKEWLANPKPQSDLQTQIRDSASLQMLQAAMDAALPENHRPIPVLTYTKYREFEHTGERPGYQDPYFTRRAMLTKALVEYLLGDKSVLDTLHDLLWAICEETSWVVPAHEEQGPNYWDIEPPIVRTEPLGAHTSLTREPDNIDLFAAETGAALAETVHLIGDDLAPEVRERVRQEVRRHIFKPYLAYGRSHWWFKGALNWNGVCNGSIGLAFLRLEDDLETKAEALAMVLEGFEAYIATGFEADGGSIEGVGYWNYGLMYYVTVAEVLREVTGGELDLLATERMKDLARYPVGMALKPPQYLNIGDSPDTVGLAKGIVQRLAERTNVPELRALLGDEDRLDMHSYPIAKLPIFLREIAWYDGKPVETPPPSDFYLPTVGVVKFVGQTGRGAPVVCALTCGHNDGHHSHVDAGNIIYHVDGESLVPDAGRGKYSKQYFRQQRYQNIFNNAYSHNIPTIGGKMQQPGPEFGGTQQFHGTIVEHGERNGKKFVVADLHTAYHIPSLTQFRRTVEFDPTTGKVVLIDTFAFSGEALSIEEAFVTWADVTAVGDRLHITGGKFEVDLQAVGATWKIERLEQASRANGRDGVLKRMTTTVSGTTFTMTITPQEG